MSEENNIAFFEKVIIKILFQKKYESIRDRILPYLSKDLFVGLNTKSLMGQILKFYEDYKTFPSSKDLYLSLQDNDDKETFKQIKDLETTDYTEEHLLKQVETHFRGMSIYNAIQDSIEKLQAGNPDEVDIEMIQKAKAFSFDGTVALDIMEGDGESFYTYLHEEHRKVPTGLKQFDFMMGGGFPRKASTLFLGGTNRGKTLIKTALGKCCVYQNQNVLYIPLEGTKENIRDRALWNIFDASEEELKKFSLDDIKALFTKTKQILKSRFLVAEYPEHTFNANKLRVLLKDLREKDGFVPDIVFIDYLGLAAPNVIYKENGAQHSALKRASEEFNAVWKEMDIAGVSSMQFNRDGYNSSDPDMDDISESFGTLFTAAEVILIIQTDEMHKENRYAYKKVKARSPNKGFVGHLHVDYGKQKIFELDQNMKNDQEKQKVQELVKAKEDEIQQMLERVDANRLKKAIEFE